MQATRTRSGETFVPCESGSHASDVAAALARELAGRRGGIVRTPREALLHPGEPVVVIDGCRSACSARLLEAHGATVVAALVLDELEGLEGLSSPSIDGVALSTVAVEAAEQLIDRPSAAPPRHPRPLPPEAAAGGDARAHTLTDYLFAIDWLTSPIGPCGGIVAAPTLAAHVSAALGVSRAAAGETLGRLEERGLVRRGDRRVIVLTEAGEAAADEEVRKHRLLERFVVDTLGYEAADCFALARNLAPSFDADATARLGFALGQPERCPHGWPVDPDVARREAQALVTLSTLRVGDRAEVVRLPEHEPGYFGRLLELGIAPGTPLVVEEVGERTTVVGVGGTSLELAADDPGHVLVRVDPAES